MLTLGSTTSLRCRRSGRRPQRFGASNLGIVSRLGEDFVWNTRSPDFGRAGSCSIASWISSTYWWRGATAIRGQSGEVQNNAGRTHLSRWRCSASDDPNSSQVWEFGLCRQVANHGDEFGACEEDAETVIRDGARIFRWQSKSWDMVKARPAKAGAGTGILNIIASGVC